MITQRENDPTTQILHKFWARAGKEIAKKYFSSRININKSHWLLLKQDKGFREEIASIRHDFAIPKLSFMEDFQVIYSPGKEEDGSKWLEEQPVQTKNKILEQIQNLIRRYKLPFYSDDFLLAHILWKDDLSKGPGSSWSMPTILLTHKIDEEFQKLPPTTQEKRMLKELFRKIFNIKGKPKSEQAKTYAYFLSALNQYKNKNRKLRAIKTAVKAYQKPNRKKYLDWIKNEGKEIKNLYTYRQLATDIYDVETEKETKKAANRLKKQKERLSKRLKN